MGVDDGVSARESVELILTAVMRSHPRDSLLKEIFRRSGKAVDRLLEHVEGCARCRQRVAQLEQQEQERIVRLHPKGEDYGPALDRAFEAFRQRQVTLDMERSEAPALLSRLLGLPPQRQRLLLDNSRRFQTWGLLELLVARGKEETFTDPGHAEEILRLSSDVSRHLPPSLYSSEVIEDLRARAWGYIANARRARGELAASEEAFEEAYLHLESGTEDPLERAILWDLEASLRRCQQDFEKALKLSQQGTAIFQRVGEHHLLGKALTNTACIYAHSKRSNRAAAVLYRALGLIAPSREPRLVFYAVHNLVDALVEEERFKAAKSVLERARPLYPYFSTPHMQIGYQFFAAKISDGLGRSEGRIKSTPR